MPALEESPEFVPLVRGRGGGEVGGAAIRNDQEVVGLCQDCAQSHICAPELPSALQRG